MDAVRFRLARRFRKQQQFTAGSSPLYSRLNGLLADWLAGDREDPLADWLVRAGCERASFDVPLLLLAGVHRDILAGRPEVGALARYYPSVGGTLSPEAGDIAACLRQAIENRAETLARFIATAQVQTNEPARGFCWLLPVTYPGWQALHLVDLGASAGLNLAADQRPFRLVDGRYGRQVIDDLGEGGGERCLLSGEGRFIPPPRTALPAIRSRLGCDLAPLALRSKQGEQTLAAFVWPDQPQRLALLRQGIAALRQVNRSAVPVRLHRVDLPDALPRFLDERLASCTDAPLVIYNTYLTTYLRDKGASLRSHLATWAARHPQPVLWLQWETLWEGPEPPEFGWVGWTADLWQAGNHAHWHLAWTHPHGCRIRWLPGWSDWAAFWHKHRSGTGY